MENMAVSHEHKLQKLHNRIMWTLLWPMGPNHDSWAMIERVKMVR